MKWGIRKYQNEDGTYTPLGLARRKSEYKGRERRSRISQDRPTMRRAKSMTNEELVAATERIRLENAYRQAMRDSSAGQSFTSNVLREVGRNTLSSFTGGAANAVGQAVGKNVVDMFTGMNIGEIESFGPASGEVVRQLNRHY